MIIDEENLVLSLSWHRKLKPCNLSMIMHLELIDRCVVKINKKPKLVSFRYAIISIAKRMKNRVKLLPL